MDCSAARPAGQHTRHTEQSVGDRQLAGEDELLRRMRTDNKSGDTREVSDLKNDQNLDKQRTQSGSEVVRIFC